MELQDSSHSYGFLPFQRRIIKIILLKSHSLLMRKNPQSLQQGFETIDSNPCSKVLSIASFSIYYR